MTDLQEEFDELNRLAEDYDDGPFDNAMRDYMMRSLKPHLRPGTNGQYFNVFSFACIRGGNGHLHQD